MEKTPAISENPFCTRRVRPGAIDYIFPPDMDQGVLIARLLQNGWRGQIIGPHGSGKSTLLKSLLAAIEQCGRRTVLVALHDGQRRLPLDMRTDSRLNPPAVLIIDGYEQLGHWNRMVWKRFCRRRGLGLVVTAHQSVGLPDLCRTGVTLESAQAVVNRLLSDREIPISQDELSRCLARHGENLRETLFDLYDIFEQRRPS